MTPWRVLLNTKRFHLLQFLLQLQLRLNRILNINKLNEILFRKNKQTKWDFSFLPSGTLFFCWKSLLHYFLFWTYNMVSTDLATYERNIYHNIRIYQFDYYYDQNTLRVLPKREIYILRKKLSVLLILSLWVLAGCCPHKKRL